MVSVGLIWLRARSEWRRHVGELVALTLLVGLVGTVVLTAVSGARRTRSSVTRLDRATLAIDATAVVADGQSKTAGAIAHLPEVEAADGFSPMSFFNERGYLPIVASIDGHLGSTLQRDRVIRGRRPDTNAPLELALSEALARRLGLDVGDHLRLTGISKAQNACVFGDNSQARPGCAAILKGFYASPPDFSSFAGPRLSLRVVGITRGINDIASRTDDLGLVFLTSAFYRAYHDDVGTQPGVAVRLRPGVTQEEFETAIKRVVPAGAIRDASSSAPVLDGLQSTVGVLANGLLAFAAVAALAGCAAIAQAFARRAAVRSGEHAVLWSLGMRRSQIVVDGSAPLVPVAVVGSGLAVVGAWLVSPLMPVGTARRVEPNPGMYFDPAVLAGGALLIALGVFGMAAFAGLWVTRRPGRRASTPRATSARPLGGVPATIGWHLALDNVRYRRGVPLRSAVSGVVLGVAGVVAVTTFGAGLTRLGHEPPRYGWAWDTTISGERPSDPETPQPEPAPTSHYWEARAARIAADPDVVGVTRMWFGFQTQVAGRRVTAFAQRQFRGDTGFTIVAGRAPAGAAEVALGAKTMRRSHIGVGDRVRVGDRDLRVVGQAIFPVTDDGYPLADGALLSAEGFDALGLGQSSGLGSTGYTAFAVELRRGADRAAATPRLTTLNNGEAPSTSRRPPEVDQLEQLDALPTVLMAFLLVVALLALGHAIVLSVRHHRRDFAVLRTVGLTPKQTARTVAGQASTLAVWGVMIGVPIGLVVGRLVWAAVARSYGIADDTAWPWLAVLLALPATLLLANALAWWPGRRAARVHPAEILRSE